MPTGSAKPSNTTRPEHNTQAGEQWVIVSRYVNFTDKRVIDLGCGHGDLVYRAADAGAAFVMGADKDLAHIPADERQVWDKPFEDPESWALRLVFEQMDIDELVKKHWGFRPAYDIGLCMSVLPYLRDFTGTLRWMARSFETTIIECQYRGDGPGPAFIPDDDEMRRRLLGSWGYVLMLGGTFVKERRVIRSIWLCEDGRR